MKDDTPTRRPGINSVEVAADILRALCDCETPVSLKNLSIAAGMPMGKVHRYLVSLTRSGLMQQGIDGLYDVGPLALRLGRLGFTQTNLMGCAMDIMRGLRAETNQTVALAAWSNLGPTIVHSEKSPGPIYMNIHTCSVLPVLGSAVGLVFAAYLPREATADLWAAERSGSDAAGGAKPISQAEVNRRIAEIRATGLCRATGMLSPGVNVMAAPIFDNHGDLAAVINVVGNQTELDISEGGPVAGALAGAAAAISARLGYGAAIPNTPRDATTTAEIDLVES